jgi:hypothetical protein
MARADTSLGATLTRSARSTVGRESTTFGFSIMITVSFGVVQSRHGSPSTLELMLYAGGAVMSFTLLEGMLSHGFRRPMPQHHTRVITLGTALNLVSVLAAVSAALGVAEAVGAATTWALAPFVAGLVFLAFESLEEAVAERLLQTIDDDRADEVEA